MKLENLYKSDINYIHGMKFFRIHLFILLLPISAIIFGSLGPNGLSKLSLIFNSATFSLNVLMAYISFNRAKKIKDKMILDYNTVSLHAEKLDSLKFFNGER